VSSKEKNLGTETMDTFKLNDGEPEPTPKTNSKDDDGENKPTPKICSKKSTSRLLQMKRKSSGTHRITNVIVTLAARTSHDGHIHIERWRAQADSGNKVQG
jgi:hypothetical protein